MKVTFGIGRIKQPSQKPFLAIGIFDGVHRGHQFLIRQMAQKARRSKSQSIVMTFFPHPQKVLNPRTRLQYLVPLKQRLRFIAETGAQVCLVISFTRAFSRLTPQQFISQYIVKTIRPREIFVGKNFRFGKRRLGDIAFLKKKGRQYGFKVHDIAPVKVSHRVVSSTLIKKLISDGNIELVRNFLGRPVSIMGKVIKGDGRGKSLGFPTANIKPYDQIIPPFGVYMTEVVIAGKTFKGMANVGIRPSFRQDNRLTVEAHIFRFHKSIYGEEIEIRFIKRIRRERKFLSRNQLIAQLQKDQKSTINFFSKARRKTIF